MIHDDDFMENVNGYIYCDTDNFESSEYVITQVFIDSINPSDGTGENC